MDLMTVDEVGEMINTRFNAGRTIGECTKAIMSVPRLGFTSNFQCGLTSFGRLGITCELGFGVFWGQVMTRIMERHLHDGTRYIVTTDYDSVFTEDDIRSLYDIMEHHPEIDALCSVQLGREIGHQLFCRTDDTGEVLKPITPSDMIQPLMKVKTAHFGLTILRCSSLREMKKPWFMGQPDPNDSWHEGRLDEDIWFWKQWWDSGNTLYQANHIVIGHAEQVITWPDQYGKPIHQSFNSWSESGKPTGVMNYKTGRRVGINEEFKLNIGSGGNHIDGYEDIDAIYGTSAFPLDWPDESCVEVRASHVLEHFPQYQLIDVVREWVRVLRPGGILKIAVPDFAKIVEKFNEDNPIWMAYCMGGQTDQNDYHKSVFYSKQLKMLLEYAGLHDIQPWISEDKDCSSLPISLNLQGVK